MNPTRLEPSERNTILVHYYRAMVGRADIWRTRMDITSNWAIGATFAVTTLALGNPSAPHEVMFIASLLTFGFLLLEARRLTFYRLWQERVLLLEKGLIHPALALPLRDTSEQQSRESLPKSSDPKIDLGQALTTHLGRTVPNMRLLTAIARRLRRLYLYLFFVQFVAWIFKLSIHPTAVNSLSECIERAQIAGLPGTGVAGLAVFSFVCAVIVAFAFGEIGSSDSYRDRPLSDSDSDPD